jgi:hypothetical protein
LDENESFEDGKNMQIDGFVIGIQGREKMSPIGGSELGLLLMMMIVSIMNRILLENLKYQ